VCSRATLSVLSESSQCAPRLRVESESLSVLSTESVTVSVLSTVLSTVCSVCSRVCAPQRPSLALQGARLRVLPPRSPAHQVSTVALARAVTCPANLNRVTFVRRPSQARPRLHGPRDGRCPPCHNRPATSNGCSGALLVCDWRSLPARPGVPLSTVRRAASIRLH
jgi:hypothetical protein